MLGEELSVDRQWFVAAPRSSGRSLDRSAFSFQLSAFSFQLSAFSISSGQARFLPPPAQDRRTRVRALRNPPPRSGAQLVANQA
jgi:hypothetical protein